MVRRNLVTLIPLCLFAFVYLLSVDPAKTLLGWDIDGSFLNAHMALQRALSGWTFYQTLGANNAPFAAQIPVFAAEALLENLRLGAAGTQWIITGGIIALLPISMIAYTAVVFPRNQVIRLIAPLAIFFNLYVAVSNNSNPYLHFNAAMAAGPLIGAFVVSLARRRSALKALLFVVAVIVVSIMGANAAGAAIGFLSVGVFAGVGLVIQRIGIRRGAIPLAIYFLLNAFWIVPTAHYYIADGSEVAQSQYAVRWGDSTLAAISEAATPHNWLRLVGSWEWVHADARGNGYTAFSSLYDSNPFYNAVAFLLMLLALSGIILRGRLAWPFAIMFALMLFLMKGTAPPFGGAYAWLYHHVPGFKAFRNPYTKFGIGAIPALAMLAAFGVDGLRSLTVGWKANATIIALAVLIVASIEPYWSGTMFKRDVYMQNYYVQIPKDYFSAANYLNDHADPFGRVLVLPFSPNLSYTALDWNFVGPDPLRFLISRPSLYESNGYADPFAGIVFSNVDKSADALLRAVDRADIQYVIVHRDVMSSIYHADHYRDMEALLRRAGAIEVRTFGRSLVLYQFPLDKSASHYDFFSIAAHAITAHNLPSTVLYNVSSRPTLSDAQPIEDAKNAGLKTLSILALPAAVGLEIGPDTQPIPVPVSRAGPSANVPVLPGPFLAVNGQLFSSNLSGDLSPGIFRVAELRNMRQSNLAWRNVDHYVGPPGSPVYRSVPIRIRPGDHVYALIYRAYSRSLSVGVSIRCCYPKHYAVLAPDEYPPLDGKWRAVAFRIDSAKSLTASLCIFGDGAALFAASEARVLDAPVDKRELISVPGAVGVPGDAFRGGKETPPFYSIASHFNSRDSAALAGDLRTSGKIRLVRSLAEAPHPEYAPPRGLGGVPISAGFPYSDRMRLTVDHRGTLIFSAAWNEGWVATSAGEPLRKVLVDGVFNGWRIAHKGTVEVEFWPRILLLWGSLVSISTALAWLLISVLFKEREGTSSVA